MPLPIKRIRKATADNALSVLILTSEVTKQIADIMQFPPAQAAAGVLLLVFETIQVRKRPRSTATARHGTAFCDRGS